MLNNLSKPIYFTIESKKFVNVMQYIFYKLLCQIETVNKAYNLINKNSNYNTYNNHWN